MIIECLSGNLGSPGTLHVSPDVQLANDIISRFGRRLDHGFHQGFGLAPQPVFQVGQLEKLLAVRIVRHEALVLHAAKSRQLGLTGPPLIGELLNTRLTLAVDVSLQLIFARQNSCPFHSGAALYREAKRVSTSALKIISQKVSAHGLT